MAEKETCGCGQVKGHAGWLNCVAKGVEVIPALEALKIAAAKTAPKEITSKEYLPWAEAGGPNDRIAKLPAVEDRSGQEPQWCERCSRRIAQGQSVCGYCGGRGVKNQDLPPDKCGGDGTYPSLPATEGQPQITFHTPESAIAKLHEIFKDLQTRFHDQWDWMDAEFSVEVLKAAIDELRQSTLPATATEGQPFQDALMAAQERYESGRPRVAYNILAYAIRAHLSKPTLPATGEVELSGIVGLVRMIRAYIQPGGGISRTAAADMTYEGFCVKVEGLLVQLQSQLTELRAENEHDKSVTAATLHDSASLREKLSQAQAKVEELTARLNRLQNPLIYTGPSYVSAVVPERCPDCDSGDFISYGTYGLICKTCWLTSLLDKAESTLQQLREELENRPRSLHTIKLFSGPYAEPRQVPVLIEADIDARDARMREIAKEANDKAPQATAEIHEADPQAEAT